MTTNRPPWHEPYPLDAGGFRDDTAPITSGDAPRQSGDEARPHDEHGMYVASPSGHSLPLHGNYVRQETMHEACDLLSIVLSASPHIAASYREQVERFIRRHGRMIQQIQDDSRG